MGDAPGGLLKHHLAWGAALGATVVLSIQVLTWVGLGLSHVTWILTYAWVVLFAIAAGRSLGRRVGRRPRFLQAALLLLVMILVSRVIYQAYMFVYINYVDPAWVETVARVWTEQLEQAGASPEQIERNIAGFRMQWETRYIFTLGIISYGIAQFVLGLVALGLVVVQPWRRRPGPASQAS